jgi:hypothetical protein
MITSDLKVRNCANLGAIEQPPADGSGVQQATPWHLPPRRRVSRIGDVAVTLCDCPAKRLDVDHE